MRANGGVFHGIVPEHMKRMAEESKKIEAKRQLV